MTNQQELPELFIVDGSNIATEGRDKPSLEQLTEAVDAFQAEYPDHKLTVVVDATFGHRIAKKEVKAFDQAIANNEIVTPPAGAIGRGDAFILAIAHKANAGVLSNDSFQEFHGEYGWLFDHGRLIGGKPVPHVGWVFVDRNPVRGPKSRESIKAAKRSSRAASSDDGSPTDAKEQAKRRVRKKGAAKAEHDAPADQAAAPAAEQRTETPKSTDHVNELMPFLEFVEQYPVGSQVTAVVDSYSSHGAYAKVDDVLVYLPLRLMSDPPPTSARKVLTLGDAVEVVIERFVPDRRSVDGALPAMASAPAAEPAGDTSDDPASDGSDEPSSSGRSSRSTSRSSRRRKSKAAAKQRAEAANSAAGDAPAEEPPHGDDAPVEQRPARKAPAKKSAASKAAAKKAPAKKKAATKKAPAKKKAAAKKAPAKKTAAAKKAAARKAPAKKSAAKKAPAKKRAAKKSAAKAES